MIQLMTVVIIMKMLDVSCGRGSFTERHLQKKKKWWALVARKRLLWLCLRYHERDARTKCHERDARTKCHERDARTKCHERDARTKCHERDARTKCHERDARTKCHERDARTKSSLKY